MIKNIPVYEAVLGDEIGIYTLALVDNPAMECKWLAFSKEDGEAKKMNFKILDEEEHKVLSVVIRADFPIIRKDDNDNYFYITFSKDTIYATAEKYLKEGFQNVIRLTHQGDEYINSFNLVQWFIKDTAKGISPAGFEDIADGSLFAEFYVTDENIWQRIKDGEFNGISMESVFEIKPKAEEQERVINTIQDLLDYLGLA